MEWRYDQMVRFCNEQYKLGNPVYSPIVHNHPIALYGGLPRTWDFWSKIDFAMLELCETMWVIQLPGWDKSVGVKAEIAFCQENAIPVKYVPITCVL